VQKQYEENPYPRWINTALEIKPDGVKRVLSKVGVQVLDETGFFSDNPQILIAGCGTGQHSLSAASRFKNSRVTAIDLSLSSLAYAKRKTQELGVTNIDYLQADILDLGMLGKKFDIIESAGVLVHMDEPVTGWRVLADCLKPGGCMKIGLYSESARKSIIKARNIISERKISTDKLDMIRYRKESIESGNPELMLLKEAEDFYSTSMLRDLIFHVKEHRFTIPQISTILDNLGLAFIGFEFPDKITSKAFKMAYPEQSAIYDLRKWHEYETIHPLLFIGMYQFWIQKPH
jgi:2-polyprenyl-3-methyl-5-hydroxy-6-metoxy-1,4-benzoquinol methylase